MYKIISKIRIDYKISIIYLIFGFLWIFFSDEFFNLLISDKNILSQFQTIKGFFFITVTSGLLYLLLNRYLSKLRIANEKAKESERLKAAFLANISHEIRTPMSGILGFSRLLAEPHLDKEDQKLYIDMIEQSGERMLDLINNIVEISKIESGSVNCKFTKINVYELFKNIHSNFKDQAEALKLNFYINKNNKINDTFFSSDLDKLNIIIKNLVKNAFKYTKSGFIEIGYQAKDNLIEFFVKDSGIGIPFNRQKAIFERFVQSDIEDIDALQGTGLGLSLSKAFVEMLGGKIWVESIEGSGSTFTFCLPDTN